MDIDVQNFDAGAMAFVDDNEYSNLTTTVTLEDGTTFERQNSPLFGKALQKIREQRREQAQTNIPNKPVSDKMPSKIANQIESTQQPKKNKLMLPIAIGGGILLLGTILYFVFRKK